MWGVILILVFIFTVLLIIFKHHSSKITKNFKSELILAMLCCVVFVWGGYKIMISFAEKEEITHFEDQSLSDLNNFSTKSDHALQADIIRPWRLKTKLDDIAGMTEAKQEAQQFIDLIKDPKKFKAIGAKPPKGLIIYGLSGTGKTSLVRAIAGEVRYTLISVSGGAFEEAYVGVGAARVRELFELARKNKPALIFIDEIDAFTPVRTKEDITQSQIQTINQFLSEFDNIDKEKNDDVFIIATTNRIEAVEPALLRPGRFDWQLQIRLPNENDREVILKEFISNIKADPKLNVALLVEKSAGFTGADLDNLVNEAAIAAVKKNKKTVDQNDFEFAFQKIAMYQKDLSPIFSVKIVSPNEIKTRLSDIAGMNEAKKEVAEIISFLKDPPAFTRLGAKPPAGVLIYGPPGTGKTMMARALAGESNATFLTVSGSDFDEHYVGVGAARVRELFKIARKYKPAIVFIDEIDSLAKERRTDDASGQDQTLNQFLNEMDNINNNLNEGIIFIGATNRIDVLDPAILRPGRFDRKVYFRLPSLQEREAILNVHLKNIHMADNISVKILAKITSGYSGADLANLVNEAAIEATRSGKNAVDMASFEEANDKIALGIYQGTGEFTKEERLRTAYHEAGHALVGLLVAHHPQILYKMTIGLRGESLGVTHFRVETEEHSYTKEQIEALIATALGGYVAEELIYGKNGVSSGVSSDLVNANRLAKDMVAKYGMGDQDSFIVSKVFPNDPAMLGDAEVIIKRNYEMAKAIVTKNRNKLDLLVKMLLEKETLDYDEIAKIVQK